MNKLLVVLLAVCLVSVQAFVKRDAEAPQNVNYIEKYQKEIQDFSKDIGNKLQEAFNPDEIKKGFSDMIDNISKAVKNFKPDGEAAKQ